MQFKSLLVAFGVAGVANGAALPEPQLETRAVESATFQIRRFSPLSGFNAVKPVVGTWSDSQWTNTGSANKIFTYGNTESLACQWTYNPSTEFLRGGGLAARNLQSNSITATPIMFGGIGEVVSVTIGPAPLHEVIFQTIQSNIHIKGWTTLGQISGNVFLGKVDGETSIIKPEDAVRFRAIGYVAPVG